jgi:Tfp pilus assembly protein PilX
MKSHRASRGVVMVTVLIFLIVITLFSISVFRSSTTNMRATGNMQVRQEASKVAAVAIEQTISNDLFATQTAAVASSPVDVDLNGDGTPDYTANLQLDCLAPCPWAATTACPRRWTCRTAPRKKSAAASRPTGTSVPKWSI